MKINNIINGAEKGIFTYTKDKIIMRATHGLVNSMWEEATGTNAEEKIFKYQISGDILIINDSDEYRRTSIK
jgi:hypothetical protein